MHTHFSAAAQYLENEKQAALELYRADRRPLKYFARHCAAVEHVLSQLWQYLFQKSDFCLLALGGFGRGELYPYSDIDLAIVTPYPLTETQTENITHFVQILWDIGLQPALKTGSIQELCDAAQQDLTSDTAFLEARFLCGNHQLATQTTQALNNQRDLATFIDGKWLEMQKRHEKQQALPLEPDLKNGAGALRDIHTMMWLAAAQGLPPRFGELRRLQILTDVEAGLLKNAHRQLARFRIELHLAAQRPQEKLIFDYQAVLAEERGLSHESRQAGSEKLMHELYRTLKTVRQLNAILIPMLRGRVYSSLPRVVVEINEHYYQIGNQIAARDLSLFQHSPEHIFILLECLQSRRDLSGIAPKTLRAWWVASQQIDQSFYFNPNNRQRFLGFFQKGEGLSQLMHWLNIYGVLARYLPEWHKIVGLLQHDLFHIYPVDDHILTVLRNMRRFAIPAYNHELPLASGLMQRFHRPHILYLAALFHDIAKGRNGDHAQLGVNDALRFGYDHKLPENDTFFLAWLVEEHLLMSSVSQKEDIADPDVVARFCSRVGTQERLDALYLLTIADIRGTNPKLWTSWKAQLLSRLYQSASALLAGQENSRDTLLLRRQKEAADELQLHGFDTKMLHRLQNVLGETYFVHHDPDEIRWHVPFLAQNHEHAQIQMRQLHPHQTLQVMVFMPNGERLFTRLCRIFSHHDLDIASARAFITEHNYILDTFIVRFPEHCLAQDCVRIQTALEIELNQFLNGKFQAQTPRHRPSRRARHLPIAPHLSLHADEERSGWYNLDLIAINRPNLLADITEIFAKHAISLRHANIVTQIDRAEDSFLIFAPHLSNPMKALAFKHDLQQILNY